SAPKAATAAARWWRRGGWKTSSTSRAATPTSSSGTCCSAGRRESRKRRSECVFAFAACGLQVGGFVGLSRWPKHFPVLVENRVDLRDSDRHHRNQKGKQAWGRRRSDDIHEHAIATGIVFV